MNVIPLTFAGIFVLGNLRFCILNNFVSFCRWGRVEVDFSHMKDQGSFVFRSNGLCLVLRLYTSWM